METTANLQSRLASLKEAEPKLRNRQLAQRLGISEAELLTLSPNEHVINIDGDWKALLKEIHTLGHVMALTRNEACVHERKGQYDNVTFYDGPHNMGVVVNPDIDLRLFMNEWMYGLFVMMPKNNGKVLYSFQFFNSRGEAVHKIFSTPKTDLAAFRKLVDKYKGSQQPIHISDRTPPESSPEKPDEEVDVKAFQQDWLDLKDTHHFFGMLKKHGLSRTQALRLAPTNMVTQVDRMTVANLLEAVAADKTSIMCFVHSPGCIQIHTGPVHRLLWHGNWFNIMDPQFNLHLNVQAIASCYVVRKPTADGQVTSLELFDADGELIVYFFGERKPGKPELKSWRDHVENIPELTEGIV